MQCQLFITGMSTFTYHLSFTLIGLLGLGVNRGPLIRLLIPIIDTLIGIISYQGSFNWALIQFVITLNKQDSNRGLNI